MSFWHFQSDWQPLSTTAVKSCELQNSKYPPTMGAVSVTWVISHICLSGIHVLKNNVKQSMWVNNQLTMSLDYLTQIYKYIYVYIHTHTRYECNLQGDFFGKSHLTGAKHIHLFTESQYLNWYTDPHTMIHVYLMVLCDVTGVLLQKVI